MAVPTRCACADVSQVGQGQDSWAGRDLGTTCLEGTGSVGAQRTWLGPFQTLRSQAGCGRPGGGQGQPSALEQAFSRPGPGEDGGLTDQPWMGHVWVGHRPAVRGAHVTQKAREKHHRPLSPAASSGLPSGPWRDMPQMSHAVNPARLGNRPSPGTGARISLGSSAHLLCLLQVHCGANCPPSSGAEKGLGEGSEFGVGWGASGKHETNPPRLAAGCWCRRGWRGSWRTVQGEVFPVGMPSRPVPTWQWSGRPSPEPLCPCVLLTPSSSPR